MNGWRTLFPNAWLVGAREFRGRTRSRSFVIGTVILAALAFAATQLPVFIDLVAGNSQTKVEVVVRASDLPADREAILDSQLNPVSGAGEYLVTWLPASGYDAALSDLEKKRFDALLVIDRDTATHDLSFTLRTDMPRDGRQVQVVSGAARMLAIEDGLVRAGTSAASVLSPANLKVVAASPGSGSERGTSLEQEISSSLLSTGLIVLIFMAIVTYGTWVAMSVAEEKGSRVMELMLNATTPLQMLAGKVLGNGAAGLAQYAIVVGAVAAGLFAQGPIHQAIVGGSSENAFGSFDVRVLGAFVVLFVLGFTLYSLLYAALGSLVSRQEDIQSATSPLMMLIMAGYFLSVFGLQAIDEPWVVVTSFVPFFSPYLMLARVAVGHVAPWEFGLSVAIMLASIGVALVFASRIYSAGVLLYGQRVGIRQVLRAARVSR
jgi:ABC-2 type transport system permease protein